MPTNSTAILDPIVAAYKATTLWAAFAIPGNWSTVTAAQAAALAQARHVDDQRGVYDQLIGLLEQTKAEAAVPRSRLDSAAYRTLAAWIDAQLLSLRNARP